MKTWPFGRNNDKYKLFGVDPKEKKKGRRNCEIYGLYLRQWNPLSPVCESKMAFANAKSLGTETSKYQDEKIKRDTKSSGERTW